MEAMIIGNQPVCLSGGAEGADLQWGMVAGTMGHQVIHFSFRGHRSLAPESELVVLPEEMLLEADEALMIANERLRRKFPSGNHYVNCLLRRNFWQIKYATSIYAVSHIDDQGRVSGGTAWAVQMFIDRNDIRHPAYVFDQNKSQWLVWDREWKSIDMPPVPNGVWTGVGTRNLNANGKAAIRNLLGYTA
jgi:hypothetical protein